MSGYGSKTNSQGEEIRANGGAPILVGEKVPGNIILSFGMSEDQNGQVSENRAEIRFKQTNGASFSYSFFDSDQEWAVDKTNRELLHICTKFVTRDEYYAIVEPATGFADFINRIKTQIIPKAEGKAFTLKIVYKQNKTSKKWFVSFPNFPNFIEEDGTTPSTLKTDPRYDFYAPVEVSDDMETVATEGSDEPLF